MRRSLVLVLAVVLMTSVCAGAVAADPPRATPSGGSAAHMTRLTQQVNELQSIMRRAGKVRCRSLSCINHALTVLNKRSISLAKFLNRYINCQRFANVTEYGDFMSSDGVNPTSGLDFTGGGDAPDARLLAWVC